MIHILLSSLLKHPSSSSWQTPTAEAFSVVDWVNPLQPLHRIQALALVLLSLPLQLDPPTSSLNLNDRARLTVQLNRNFSPTVPSVKLRLALSTNNLRRVSSEPHLTSYSILQHPLNKLSLTRAVPPTSRSELLPILRVLATHSPGPLLLPPLPPRPSNDPPTLTTPLLLPTPTRNQRPNPRSSLPRSEKEERGLMLFIVIKMRRWCLFRVMV